MAPRGRGAAINPLGRFDTVHLHVLGEALDAAATENPGGVQVRTELRDEHARTVINRVESPDLPFSWSLNPYRGCEHGCIYCYARPGHEYFNLSSGLDFETVIFAKRDAPHLLRRELSADSWRGEPLTMSGVTDPYQPIERDLEITRACLEVCAEFRQPVTIVTKSRLVLRDLDVLRRLNEHSAVSVAVSLTTLDNALAAAMEPRAASPSARLETMRALSAARIPVGVMTAPIIPRVNDHEIPSLLRAAAEAGARGAGFVMLRLPYQIKALFEDWLKRHFPDRAAHVLSLVRQMHGGELYDARWFHRQRGEGAYAEQVKATFDLFVKQLGLDGARWRPSSENFRKPGGQGELF